MAKSSAIISVGLVSGEECLGPGRARKELFYARPW